MSTIEKGKISRRGFLKAAGIGAAVSAGLMSGCSPSTASNESTATTESTASNGYIGGTSWLGEAPQIAESDIANVYDYDIVVCGSGNSGVQAALAAAEGGAKVAVIEQAGRYTAYGEDVGHVNSQFLIERGFGPYDEGEIVAEFMKRSAGRSNLELVRKFVANSGEMFDHLCSLVSWPDDRIETFSYDKTDLSPFDESQYVIHQPLSSITENEVTYPISRGGYKTWPCTVQFMGTNVENGDKFFGTSRLGDVMQFAILKAQELGAEWYFGETATVLVQDESGAVTGVIAKNGDGTYDQFNASKGVALCTGGFESNTQMVWELLPEVRETSERHGLTLSDLNPGETPNVGAGHKMGCWAGGMIEAGARGGMSVGGGASGPWGASPFLWLNCEGKRFMNEAATAAAYQETLRQPIGGIAGVTDANWEKTLKNSSVDHMCANFGRQIWYEDLKNDMAAVALDDPEGTSVRGCSVAQRTPCIMYASETLDGLADLLGYTGDSKEAFLESIERYNELCHAGVDSDFGKDECLMNPIETAPFYGWGSGSPDGAGNNGILSIGLVTVCGLTTNGDLQVLDANNQPIPGLYTAGNTCGGRYGWQYSTPFAGNSVGMAMTHGRVLGKLLTDQEIS